MATSTMVDPERLSSWCVPRLYRRKLGETRRGAEPLLVVEAWARDRASPPLLVLAGNRGTGKSHAAAWWLWNAYSASPPSTMAESRRWYESRRIQRLDRWSQAAIDGVVRPAAMVLDDIGSEPADRQGWWVSLFEEIASVRMEELRRTVITSNMSPGTWRQRYGDRLYDRLREGAKWHVFGGGSLRGGHPSPHIR